MKQIKKVWKMEKINFSNKIIFHLDQLKDWEFHYKNKI